MIKVFDHEGWFGIVPIYAADTKTDMPTLIGRIPYTTWAVSAMAYVFQAVARTILFINPDAEPMFPIKIRRLDRPFKLEVGGEQ